MVETQIALLRGVNVGGKNKLPMKDLAAMFVAAGCAAVVTYIQSGNIVCKARPALGKNLAAVIERAIEERFGFRVPVVLRTADELKELIDRNPFVKQGADPELLHVGFLAKAPSASQVAALDPQRSPPDEFVVLGREVYFRFPNGLARTKLTNAYFDSKLATVSTVRNWRTVLKLLELAQA